MHIKRSLEKIVSGGQTGVDRAALDVALAHKIPCGGWCPKGRIAEDGVIFERYPVKETSTSDYETRTELNVRDSEGTLILNLGELNGGTALTVKFAKQHKRPYLIVDLDNCSANVLGAFWNWVGKNHIKILNVAGPRESKLPGIYKLAKKFLEEVFSAK